MHQAGWPGLGAVKGPPISLGAASISAQLQASGVAHQLKSFAVNSPAFSPCAVVDWALAGADEDSVLCFGAFVWAEPQLRSVLGALRAAGYRGSIALGGPQVRSGLILCAGCLGVWPTHLHGAGNMHWGSLGWAEQALAVNPCSFESLVLVAV